MKNITIKDMAKQLQVSTATVSRALNDTGYTSPEVKKRVLDLAKETNYIPNNIAKILKSNQTNMIGLVVPDISNRYYVSAAKGIEDTLSSPDLTLVFSSSNESLADEKKIFKAMIEQRVDVLVMATAGMTAKDLRLASTNQIPVILFDRKVEGTDFDGVFENNYQKAYDLAQQTLDRGHSHVGILAGSQKVSPGVERLQAIRDCFAANKVRLEENQIFYGDFTREQGDVAAGYFLQLENRPSAVLSCNNTMTLGFIQHLFQQDKNLMKQLFIASYGSIELDMMFSQDCYFSIEQHPYEMGVEMGKIINQIFAEKGEHRTKTIIF